MIAGPHRRYLIRSENRRQLAFGIRVIFCKHLGDQLQTRVWDRNGPNIRDIFLVGPQIFITRWQEVVMHIVGLAGSVLVGAGDDHGFRAIFHVGQRKQIAAAEVQLPLANR